MSATERIEDISELQAPYGKQLRIQTVTYEGGMQLLRLRIKEGKRFTMLDLDPDTAGKLSEQLLAWHTKVNR